MVAAIFIRPQRYEKKAHIGTLGVAFRGPRLRGDDRTEQYYGVGVPAFAGMTRSRGEFNGRPQGHAPT